MKKLMVLLIAVAMIAVVAAPASALESVFKGYWRTRAFTTQNFDGNDDSLTMNYGTATAPAWAKSSRYDWSGVDTRTRLFYTAIINDNLKFVNTFEIDAVWGSTGGGSGQVQLTAGSGSGGYNADGDFGTDGVGVEVKHSYADFMLPWAPIFGKVGLQPIVLGRGFLLNDDFAAAVVGFKSDVVTVPLIWIKAYEGGLGYNKWDTDFYGIAPTIKPADNMSFTPYFVYAYSDRLAAWSPAYTAGAIASSAISELNMYYAGLDVDLKFDPVSVWLTGIYQGGDADILGTNASVDFKAWLAAAGFKVNINMFEVHGQAFYATGDDTADSDIETFFVPSPGAAQGQSYYWSEIMGLGVFDRSGNATVAVKSANACGDHISNILAANIGVAVKPMPDLTITLDGWYAQLAEERTLTESTNPTAKDDYLGTEVDLRITYQLVKNLNLDLIGAYLFMGDATYAGPADENPWEAGAQLSLTF